MTDENSSVAPPRPLARAAAMVAIVTLVGAVALAAVGVGSNLASVLLAMVALFAAVLAGWYAISRRGPIRVVSLVVVAASLLLLVVALAIGDLMPARLIAMVLLGGVSVAAAGYALRSDRSTPVVDEAPAPRPSHPVLLMNPWSGGGKVESFHLVDECRKRGIEPIVLQSGDDLLQLAEDAIARGADVIGMAGGDGSQALVSSVASRKGIPHVVVPAGTRNHFALDLGLDRDDVVGALEAFVDGFERRIDLAEVNGRVFVNNASLGLYAEIVRSEEYRDAKLQTAASKLPELLGPDAEPLDLRFTGPDGDEIPTAHLIQVSNDPYELHHVRGRGTRARMDLGVLGIVTARIESAADAERFVSLEALGQLDRFPGYREWTASSFEVRSGAPIQIGVDGESLSMDPPLVFTSTPGALRVRLPRNAPGLSPAARAVHTTSGSTLSALVRVVAGRPADAG